MNEDEKVFESLLLGGIIGASLSNILKEDTTVGAIAGAVIQLPIEPVKSRKVKSANNQS
jgi:hypothetical protein